MSALDKEFAAILDGEAGEDEIKAFLVRSVDLMGDPDALAAGAAALRARMTRIEAPPGAIDVCGTGGDGAHTLNVSTAVAFVLAGAGVPVAKHGNRAMSSKSGAADVLEALGVRLTGERAILERCLGKANIAFLFAQNHHPAMRHVAPARRALGHRTIFNLLGPLSNPAGVKRQLVGVFSPDFVAPVAQALLRLGADAAWTAHGAGGLDELSCEGENLIAELKSGIVGTRHVSAADAHLSAAPNSAIAGGDAHANAAALRALLMRESAGGPYDEMVQLNAAAAFIVAGRAQDLAQGARLAFDSLQSGAALAALETLIDLTRDAP